MQKRKSICKQLGIKQEELAMFLNISKGQLAMYETGKRDLPTSATLQLAPMLKFMQDESLKSGSAEMLKFQTEQQKKVLEQLLKDNKYHQIILKKKLEIAEKKYQSNVAAMQLMRYLEKEAPETRLIKVIEAKATSELEKNGLEVVTKYKIQKEVLQAEEKILLKLLG
ncbi:helix-turn-helix domain-containing protein [Flavobacterium terrigena]|uniref:Helix-turn-helix n=1 Tax=Flavobacterium terrigena TaxID=402734 RepID=A0A1H6UQS4_9FLAO|nr:helix-turn-helix transcriptional regulator [Flavobacterium terrigena]SEI90610.1 Helix-turn-helix [Flavobacterium terrigena]